MRGFSSQSVFPSTLNMFSYEPLMSPRTVQEELVGPDSLETAIYNSWVVTMPTRRPETPGSVFACSESCWLWSAAQFTQETIPTALATEESYPV